MKEKTTTETKQIRALKPSCVCVCVFVRVCARYQRSRQGFHPPNMWPRGPPGALQGDSKRPGGSLCGSASNWLLGIRGGGRRGGERGPDWTAGCCYKPRLQSPEQQRPDCTGRHEPDRTGSSGLSRTRRRTPEREPAVSLGLLCTDSLLKREYFYEI